MKKYTNLITKEERLHMMKLGMLTALRHSPGITKTAFAVSDIYKGPASFMRGSILLSVLSGVPLGVAWHFLDQRTLGRRKKERELQEELNLYRDITSNFESNLATEKSPDKVIG